MRISTSQWYQQSVDAMLARQRELGETEVQVASGKRIQRPSDDPSAAVRVLDIKESQARLAQFQRNADAAMARLEQEESALIAITDLLQSVRELAVQGANGTLDVRDRSAIATEVRAHMQSFLNLANSQDANGEFLFAGFQSETRPFSHDGLGGFSYHGDDGQRMIEIGAGREVASGDPGSVFMDFAAAGGGTTNIGAVLYRLATSLEAGNADPAAMSDIDTAMDRVVVTRTKIGARMNAVDDQKAANDAFDLAVTELRSSLEDLDYAEAIGRFNQQLAALQASQQAFIKVQGLSLFDFIR